MHALSAVFALLVAAAGWYYMFYSRAAQRLGDVEGQRLNLRRVRLRKITGFIMILLATCFFTLFWTFDPNHAPGAFVLMALAVLVLLGAIVVLAMIDLRLTWQIRRRTQREHP